MMDARTTRSSILICALWVFAQAFWAVPVQADPTLAPAARTTQSARPLLEACPAPARGAQLADLAGTECCKNQKGICGCRAGKLVCCDGKPSTHPGCTCRGDDGLLE